MSRHTRMKEYYAQAEYEQPDEEYSDDEQASEDIQELKSYFNNLFTLQEIQQIYRDQGTFETSLERLETLAKAKEERAKKAEQKRQQKEKELKDKEQRESQKIQLQLVKKISAQEKTKHDRKALLARYNSRYEVIAVDFVNQRRNIINVIVFGHVDSGKSTLVGKLLQITKVVDSKTMRKIQKQAHQIGRQSFRFAWVCDQGKQERTRGVTIDINNKLIKTNNRQINLLDSPGHRDFVPNMITGAIQADHAILVVDVCSFQTGLASINKQHLHIIKSFGVHKIVVAINKMDLVEWSKDRFQTIVNKFLELFQQLRIDRSQLIFIPISAFHQRNLQKRPKEADFYKGKPLLEVLDALDVPLREENKPFRMIITNVHQSSIGKLKGHVLTGQIKSGFLSKESGTLRVQPAGVDCHIKDFLVEDQRRKWASVGDTVQIGVKLLKEDELQSVRIGHVLSSVQLCCPVATTVLVQLLVLEVECPVLRGIPVVMYIGGQKIEANIVRHEALLDGKTGVALKKNPRLLRSGQCGVVLVRGKERFFVQLFSNMRSLGRVILREGSQTIGVGAVVQIVD